MTGFLIACLLLVCGFVLTVRSNLEIAQQNSGFRLPFLYASHALRPSARALRRRAIGTVAIIAGSGRIADALWDSRPGVALGVLVSLLAAGCVLPPLVVTVRHNRLQPK